LAGESPETLYDVFVVEYTLDDVLPVPTVVVSVMV
jgi:uncharacterized protein YcnI